MPINPYFSSKVPSEQDLYESLVIESIRQYGIEAYYLPRKIVNTNELWNEAVVSEFAEAFGCEMYVESVDGYEGDGNLLSTFGLQVKNQMKLVVARSRWKELVGRHQTYGANIRPKEGDLIWIPMVKGMFEIQFTDGDTPFYQLQNIPTYSLTVELFEYSSEKFNTCVPEIDKFEIDYASRYFIPASSLNNVEFNIGEKIYQIVEDDQDVLLQLGSFQLSLGEQDLSLTGFDTIVNAEVAEVTDEGVYVVGIQAQDGESFFQPSNTTGSALFGTESGAQYNVLLETDPEGEIIEDTTVLKTVEDNDRHAKNETFEIKGNDFISFDETNPFGEPDQI
jgi:hypothetical protein